MGRDELYDRREQTLVKHYILEHYLERFACIVGSAWNAITYVDCFSGPWNVRSPQLEDSSFAIAISKLKAARRSISNLRHARGKGELAIRCFFLEQDSQAYEELHRFADTVTDVEIETANKSLTDAIPDILRFMRRANNAFPFIFIDPTGWTGFPIDVISPLLQQKPGEVLINFMTGHIVRFANSSDVKTQDSFAKLFGSINYRERITGIDGYDKEEEIVRCYCDAIREAGKFDHVCQAIVLRPENDKTHFHLLYATRDLKGVEVFKKVEEAAMSKMESLRATAQARNRQEKHSQQELFAAEDMHRPNHYNMLRDRYLSRAFEALDKRLRAQHELSYDTAWIDALSNPLVWEADLRDWIALQKKAGRLEVIGMKPRQRYPRRDEDNRLVWRPR